MANMRDTKVGAIFVQEVTIPFGFLNGVWIYVGVNPKAEVLKTFAWIAERFAPNFQFGLVFLLIPILTTIFYVVVSLVVGGWLGLIAVGFAYLAGLTILTGSLLGIVFFILAIILGFLAPILQDQKSRSRDFY